MSNTPSDAEIEKLAAEHLKAHAQFQIGSQVWFEGEVEFARAILAKWGTPQPAPMSPANRLVAYSAATRLRELGFEWDATAEAWLQPAPSAQAADSVLEDAARYRWLREGNDAKHGAAWYVAVNLYGCEWDAAIDAAMNKGGAT